MENVNFITNDEPNRNVRNSHITYEETNVEEDFRAYAKLTSLDIDQMPAVEINGKVYSGDIEELKNIVSM